MKLSDAFDSGVLDKKMHSRLIDNLDFYAQRAGVPPDAICRHLRDYVGDVEVAWMKSYLRNRRSPPTGLSYAGDGIPAVDVRMVGLAGCFVRNFVDARVVMLEQVIEAEPSCSVLLIPNFCLGNNRPAAWRVEKVVNLLIKRSCSGGSTVVRVVDAERMVDTYGQAAADVVARYTKVTRAKV